MWRWLRALLRKAPAPEASATAPPALRAKHEGLSTKERLRRYPGGHVTIRGEVVQSKPERRIANFLHLRGVEYVYEAQMPGATPDFYLPAHGIVIEHWGMESARYRQRRAEKTRLYLSRGLRLVETQKADVPRLERVLEARLRKVEPRIFES